MPLSRVFRSFAHRNFRLFFLGQGLSLIGTWAQQTAMPWLVYHLTGSEFWLGLVTFSGQVPSFLCAPIAGWAADRFPRRRLIMVTQFLAMLQALALAWLYFSGDITRWHILALSAALGVVTAFDLTARQAFLSEMLDRKEDLGNAIALNSSMFNGARLVGPALAGMLIPVVKEGGCFLVNALSYLAVLIALAAMRLRDRPRPTHHASIGEGLREGMTYALGSGPIRTLLGMVALVSLFAVPYAVLVPVYVKQVLHGGPELFGVVLSAPGVGAVVGAFLLAAHVDVRGMLRWVGGAPVLIGLGLLGFAFSPGLGSALPLLVLVGFAVMVLLTSCNTTIQAIVEEDKRGRVMSLYAMAFMGLNPLGSLAAGALAEHIGLAWTLRIGATACLVGAVFFRLRLARPLRERVDAILWGHLRLSGEPPESPR